jgi:nuclear pore complex protein Nup98-Nup96
LGSPASNPGTAGAFGKLVQPATSGAFGLGTFGTPNTNATSGLGNATTTPATTLAGFGSGSQQTGGFGTSTSTQQNKPTFGSLGTTASNTTSPATVSTFISFSQKPTGTTLGGGFGSGTGGFGSTNSASTKGLGSFGNTTSSLATTGAALGISLGTGNTNVGGFGSAGSSFNKPATSTFSLGGGGLGNNIGSTGSGFGSSEKGSFGIRLKIGLKVPSQNNAGNGLLSSQPQQNTNHLQQNITASPYGSNPLFDTGGASSYSGNASKPVVPMATLMPREGKDEKNPAILAGFRLTPSAGKSRFSLGGSSSPFGGSPFNHRKRDVLGLGTPTKVILNPNPSSGSGIELTPEAFVVPKRGLKGLETHRGKRELTIGGDGEVGGFETGSAAASSGGTLKSSVIDPHLERESREMDRQAVEQKSYKRVDSEESRPQLASSKPASTSKSNGLDDHASLSQRLSSTPPYPAACTDKTLHVLALEEGQYWTMPAMSTILAMPDVGAVPNFVVGRKGYGQVRFNQPVDLSQVRSIPDVPGTVVILDLKVCTVYPDESIKPRLGQGLNVPAIITLEKCWPVSKQTRRPILDVENPRFIAHVERLKRQPATEFVDYIANTGSWIFKVQHF